MSLVTTTVEDLPSLVGTRIGPGGWHDVPQSMIDAFADVTGDDRWIHVDPGRASRGPFSGTIAHGLLTLSLAPALSAGLLRVEGVGLAVSYGFDRVRFPSPVPAGTAVRGTLVVDEVTEVPGGAQLVATLTVERDGGTRPVCVAVQVTRLYR